jgi:hypothetical protein
MIYERSDSGRVLCDLCGEQIGVYEPVVYLAGPFFKRTYRAAEPAIDDIADGTVLHASCYDVRGACPPTAGELPIPGGCHTRSPGASRSGDISRGT